MSDAVNAISEFQTLRSTISFLEKKGELIHITKRVKPEYELSAIIQDIQSTINKAIIFEKVDGFSSTIVSNICGSHKNIAFALSCDPCSIAGTWAAKADKFSGSNYQSSFSSSLDMKRMDMKELPPIVFHDKDAGPYVTAGIVLSKNPKTGKVNLSFHRIQMRSSEELGIRLSPSGHLFMNQKICEEQSKSLECAILIGNSPLLMLAAATTISYSDSELDLASHYLGKPWPLRKCSMIDLDVPEDTEIVIEGEIPPNIRKNEGPFGEWMGYYASVAPNHVFNVRGVFGKENPVYYTVVAGSREEILLTGIPIAGSILRAMKVFVPSVIDVVCWPVIQFCVIKVKKQLEGEERKALLAALGAELNRILYAIVVDEDVDIYNPSDVIWAISTRCRPDKDIFIIPGVPSFARDPHERHWGRVAIDATVPLQMVEDFERKKISIPGKVRWEDYI